MVCFSNERGRGSRSEDQETCRSVRFGSVRKEPREQVRRKRGQVRRKSPQREMLLKRNLGKQFVRAFSSCELYVWGKGGNGMLGLGNTSLQDVLVPHKVSFPSSEGETIDSFRSVALGTNHSLFVSADGSLFASGKPEHGQLGLGQPVSDTVRGGGLLNFAQVLGTPRHVSGVQDVCAVECGENHSLALDKSGRVWSWGYGGRGYPLPSTGALGHGDRETLWEPRQVQGLEGEEIVEIATGKLHSFARSSSGKLFSWGEGEYGRLGNAGTSDVLEPMEIPASLFMGEKVVCVRSGSMFGLALTESGKLFSWGRNDHAQLGLRASFAMDFYALESSPLFLEELEAHRFVDLSCSERHVIGCTDEGLVFVWGDSLHYGPTDLTHLFMERKVVSVGAGHKYSLAVDEQGVCYSWGKGRSRCLGHGDTSNQDRPGRIDAFIGKKVVKAFAGPTTAAALVEI